MEKEATTELTQRVLDFTTKTEWSSIPPEIQHQAKRSLMDALGSLLAGTQTPVAHIMADFAKENFDGDESRILPSGIRASVTGAVLANGFSGNALDIDDGHFDCKGHPGAVIFSSLLGLVEMEGAKKSGKEFLTALVVGNEVAIRAGQIRHGTYETYHSSGSWSPLGVCAGAGALLSLSQTVIREAMGAAEYHACIAPMMKGIAKPSMTKDSMGWGAMVGVASVLMAQKGFTGINPLFDDAPNPQTVLNLGHKWEIINLVWKQYASCRWSHAGIDCALHVHAQMKEAGVPLMEIEKIHILTYNYAKSLSTMHPRDTEEAQYNIAYPLAATLTDGEFGPKQALPPRIFDKDILALADKVEVEASEELERIHNEEGKMTAQVTVTIKGGRRFQSPLMRDRWAPDAPPSDQDLEKKFLWLVSPVLGKEKAEKLVEMIWNLEKAESVIDLIDLCVL